MQAEIWLRSGEYGPVALNRCFWAENGVEGNGCVEGCYFRAGGEKNFAFFQKKSCTRPDMEYNYYWK